VHRAISTYIAMRYC